ncbi:DNA-binding MarR family transcriptional regulator [Kibdelosporangium banguiense]|uniref:DNA-binding MarR family transcriptional regulator n=1 Tax=Kibdelosporangium banguiense TaxID=1365924 RepID=A0ABS4TTT5_9PSEU|nr:MarR family transcriptional regulator [Kibdelosporangium banguiense]MBP2327810.1 DNA-binding MarR family transcriptional regulator [Kibdelosporangium banguiense]
MKHVDNDAEEFGRDPDDLLFDPRVRNALAQFALGDDTGVLEAAAAIRAAARGLERLRSRGTDSRGLSPGALDILIRLSGTEDGISIKDLAGSAGVSSRNVTGLVDTLERGGLAVRVPDPQDRRSVLARITPSGRTWLEEFRRPTQAAMAAVFRGFTPAETTLLRHLCLRVVENQHQLARYVEEQT